MTLSSIFSLYRPFLNFDTKNRRSWFFIALLCLGNIAQAILIVVSNNFLNLFLGILIAPPFSMATLCVAGLQYLLTIGIYTLTAGFNSFVGDKLIEHFNLVVVKTFEKWMQTKTYVGAHFLGQRKVVNAAGVFSYDIQEANRLAVRLSDNFLNTFFAAIAGLYGLWQLSSPLTIPIGSTFIVIPGYIAIGALIYALVNNLIINKFAHQLEEVTEKQHVLVNKLEAQVHHVEKNAEGIELLNAAKRERKNFIRMLKQTTIYNAILAKLQASLISFIALNDHLRYFVGIVLCIPQILSKKMSIDNLLVVGDYFTRVTSPFTWRYDNYEELAYLKVMVNKLKALHEEMDEWQRIKERNNLKVEIGDELAFQSLQIRKKDQSPLLSVEKFTFSKGKVTLIQGPSGSGKSTIIKTINRSWPYAQGLIVTPWKDIHNIPQKPVFPHQGNLYEAILYPKYEKLMSNEYKAKIDALLIDFKFEANVINERNEIRDWGKTLSGGEQQRIALIRAILFQPKVVVMDEPWSALDHQLQEHCEQLVTKFLKENGITAILIDHRETGNSNKAGPICDEIVYLKDKRLTRTS